MVFDSEIETQLWSIAEKGQFALFLDIATPKPGNVHRYKDHHDTRLIHFGASLIQLGHPFYQAAKSGYSLSKQNTGPEARLGELIKNAVQASMEPHGKNTLLGSILLFIPITIAAGALIPQSKITPNLLREKIVEELQNSTVEDAVELIRTLQIASPGGAKPKTPQWTADQEAFDFQSPHTIDQLHRMNYTLKDLQGLAASYDAIAEEYATDFSYIFDTLYPQIVKNLNQYPHIEDAMLSTYLWMLSKRPDTFIQRKVGIQAAEEVQKRAKKVYSSIIDRSESQWLKRIESFDEYLRSEGSNLNPGTTADLLSAGVFLALLCHAIQTIL